MQHIDNQEEGPGKPVQAVAFDTEGTGENTIKPGKHAVQRKPIRSASSLPGQAGTKYATTARRLKKQCISQISKCKVQNCGMVTGHDL
jgi:hypothetical protein